MSADPQPDPAIEDALVDLFARSAQGVGTDADPLVAGGLAQGRTRRRRRRITTVVGGALALGLVCTGGVFVAGLRQPDLRSDAVVAADSSPPRLDKSVNVLLMGLDTRKDQDGNALPPQFVQDELHAGSSSDVGGYNADTIIVLHVPVGGGKATALSIPRDDYVMTYNGDGSEQGMHKIKEAYGIAKANVTPSLRAKGLKGADLEKAGRDAGREATVQTVQKLLDQPVDHFAEFSMVGFYDIAKAVGPVTVCLNHATKDPAMAGQGSGADFKQGLNTLDPAQALAFVRQRHSLPNGDFDRTHRQQAFIAAVEYKLRQQGTLNDLPKLAQLFEVLKKDVVIDAQWNLLDFAQQAMSLTGGGAEFSTLPIQAFAVHGGQDVNTVDPDQLKQIAQQTFNPPSAPASASPLPMQGKPVQSGDIPCVD